MKRIISALLTVAFSLTTTVCSAAGPVVSKEAKAIAEIKQLGGEVNNIGLDPEEPEMKVSFRDCQKVTNSALVYVKAVPRVTLLILAGTQVTDAGLRHLKDLTQLTWLDLTKTQVTDAGLHRLKV